MQSQKHSRRLNREAEKNEMEAAKSLYDRLKNKYGESMEEIPDPDGNIQEVYGADCPNCEGVLNVTREPNSYPAQKIVCTGSCSPKRSELL